MGEGRHRREGPREPGIERWRRERREMSSTQRRRRTIDPVVGLTLSIALAVIVVSPERDSYVVVEEQWQAAAAIGFLLVCWRAVRLIRDNGEDGTDARKSD